MGHPDGQNYPIWRGPDFIANTAFPISASNPLAVQGGITNFASFVIFAAARAPQGVTVTVTFYTDATLSVSVGSFSWILPQNVSLHTIVPSLGNFVVINMTTADPNPLGMPVAVFPTNSPTSRPDYMAPGNFVEGTAVNVPQSSTLITKLPYLMTGDAYWYANDPNTTGKLQARFSLLNVGSAELATMDIQPTLTTVRGSLVVPASPVAVVIQNTDAAAAHVVNFFAAVDGG